MINYNNMMECAAAYCRGNKGVWLHITNAQLRACMDPQKAETWAEENKLECNAYRTSTNEGYKFRSI